MKHTYAISTALVASFAFAFSAAAEEKSILLKQSLPVGKKIHQLTEMNQKMKMGGIPGAPDGGGMNMTNKIDMGMTMDISKAGEGKKAVIEYGNMKMAMDAGIFKQEFDSKDPGNPFSAIAGKKLTVIYDKDDNIEKVEGVDELLGDAAAQPGIGDMLKGIFSEDQIENMVKQGLLQMVPKKSIKIGDSWPYTMETPMPQGGGTLKVKGTYTLKKFEDLEGHPCAVIAMKGALETDGKTKMGNARPRDRDGIQRVQLSRRHLLRQQARLASQD